MDVVGVKQKAAKRCVIRVACRWGYTQLWHETATKQFSLDPRNETPSQKVQKMQESAVPETSLVWIVTTKPRTTKCAPALQLPSVDLLCPHVGCGPHGTAIQTPHRAFRADAFQFISNKTTE